MQRPNRNGEFLPIVAVFHHAAPCFSCQSLGMLVLSLRLLKPRSGSEEMKWNLADFALSTHLEISIELMKRAGLPEMEITQHQSCEAELRKIMHRLGKLTLLPTEEPKEGELKNWFATFVFELEK